MANGDGAPRAAEERVYAVERLNAAVGRRTRSRHHFEAARGTSAELEANAAMHSADEQAAARERWLKWVDERD